MSGSSPLRLFEGFGVELEYMIVDAEKLNVRPISDEVLKAVAGEIVDSVDRPDGVTWSNELVLHVLEMKGTRPLSQLEGAAAGFQSNVQHVNEILRPKGCRLMPTGMHPWMDPLSEMVLWPHEYHAVYETFHRIFDCRGHGWANVQSVHLNLPFFDDEEFGRLHAAIRVLLPLLPALAASSPLVEDKPTGLIDNRLEFYRTNSAVIPSIAGQVIPERVFTKQDYEATILERIYRDVEPYDPNGTLRDEFLNARGAIARFSRNAIEIRLLDVQECPAADLALCALIVRVLQLLLSGDTTDLQALQSCEVDGLHAVLLAGIQGGDRARITDRSYLQTFGIAAGEATMGEVWRHLYDRTKEDLPQEFRKPLEVILRNGPLGRRILNALGTTPTRNRLTQVYAELCECLDEGRQFLAP